MKLKTLDVEKIATAIEADAGQALPGLRRSLKQARNGEYAAVHTAEKLKARRGRPVGSVKNNPLKAISLRLDANTLEKWRSTGRGWQTRAANVLAKHVPKSP